MSTVRNPVTPDPCLERRLVTKKRGDWQGAVAGLLALLVVAVTPHEGAAQTATISGFVVDASTGRPIELANVVVRPPGAAPLRGASTNRDGLFVLSRLEPGRYALEVSFIGFEPYRDTLALRADDSRILNIELRAVSEALEEVVVETERQGGAARITAGQQTVRPRDIEFVPGPDVSGDLASYLTTLPGVVATGDRGGQLFIRGGEPTQNLVLLDGIQLYQPFHILGFYSAFPSDIISRADLYAGGYGSKFGGRISSVIDVSTRQGNMRRYAGSLSLSPFISTALLEGPIIPDRISLLASVRQSTVEQGASRYLAEPLPFSFGDLFAKLQAEVTRNSRISVTALKTYDRGVLVEGAGGAAREEIRWRNEGVGLRLLLLPRIFAIMADARLSFSRLESELGPPEDPIRLSQADNTTISLDGTYFGDRVDAEAGSMLQINRLSSALGGLYQNVEFRGAHVAQWGSYLELDIELLRGLRVRPGLRAQFYRVRFEPYLEPRLRLVWEQGLHQVSAAAGIYHQEIIGIADRRDAASVFTVWTNIAKDDPFIENVVAGRPQRATHALLGYRITPAPWLELSVEGYHKDLDHLFIAEWTSFPRLTTRLQKASGVSTGVDTRIEVRGRLGYGYVGYGLSRTRYRVEDGPFQHSRGERDYVFRPPHDRRHQVNALLSTQALGFGLNVRWEFGSGFPFSRAIGFDGWALVDDVAKATDLVSSRRVLYERPYNAVLPTYHRLDVSIERTFTLGRATATAQASAINVYDRRNLYYLDVFTLERADQLPFVPSLGLKVGIE